MSESERNDLEFAERVAAPLRNAETVEPEFEKRLLAAARTAVARGDAPWSSASGRTVSHRGWRRLTARRYIAVSPLAGLAATALFAVAVAGATLSLRPTRGADAPGAADFSAATIPNDAGRVVHFALVAPAAATVALVGDFNGWSVSATPLTRGAIDGLWNVTVPLVEGSYQYSFIIDGTVWLADPAAAIALEDEFGTPSSLVIVRNSSAG